MGIMILPYVADDETVRGERPMDPKSNRAPDDFPWQAGFEEKLLAEY